MNKSKLNRSLLTDSISYLYLTILAVIAAFPLLWIILSAVKEKGEMITNPTALFPKKLTLDNFRVVIEQLHFGSNMLNSVIVAGCTTIVSVIIAALGAYGVVRFFPRFGKVMTRVLITTYMFPPILLAVPYSILVGKAGLVNSRIGLVITYLSFSVPYAIWLLVGFFKTVPLEMEEAAYVDGANRLQVFIQIVMPIVTPGVIAVAIYTFINAWNEFLYSLILINSSNKMTVGIILKSLEGQEVMDWGVMMAASAMVVIPSVIFFMLIQKKIAGGLAAGSIK
jgi:multiple sugar transport system permease protein